MKEPKIKTQPSLVEEIVRLYPEADVEVRRVEGEGGLVVIAVTVLMNDGNLKTIKIRSDPNS